jgi:hypothetical protein
VLSDTVHETAADRRVLSKIVLQYAIYHSPLGLDHMPAELPGLVEEPNRALYKGRQGERRPAPPRPSRQDHSRLMQLA